MEDIDLENNDYMFLDKNGNKVNKNDYLKISGHPNPQVNGEDYLCLRMWSLSSTLVECLKDVNGIVRHVVVDFKFLEKQQ